MRPLTRLGDSGNIAFGLLGWWNMPNYEGMGLDALTAEVDRIEPYLIQVDWPATTSMMIPSVLRSADELRDAIMACTDPDTARRNGLGERLQAIRVERERLLAEKRLRQEGLTGQRVPREWRGPWRT